MKLRLLVVVINYATPDLTKNCVKSVIKQLPLNSEIAIIDNASPDDSLVQLRQFLVDTDDPRIHLVESKKNLGFSGGNNLGMSTKSADRYLLLNSDAKMPERSLAKLMDVLEHHENAGIVSPRLIWPDGTPQVSNFRFQTPISEFIHAAGTGFFTNLLSRWNVPTKINMEAIRTNWTSFACVLLRKDVLETVGFMDDAYFMYYEDADFCRRAANSGWHVINDPSVQVIHFRGGSSDVKSNTANKKRVPKYVYHSRSRYYAKFYGGRWGLILANVCWIAGRTISLIRQLDKNYIPPTCEKEWLDIWTNFFNPLNKRDTL